MQRTHPLARKSAGVFSLAALTVALSQVAFAEDTGRFLARHWARPLAAQGKPPAAFSALEASLDPTACGTCHRAQLDDWRSSRHSRAMGPGVSGQLVDMDAAAVDEHQNCLRCHAPLAEQEASLAKAITTRSKAGLHEQGLVCAGCHVRANVRHGPTRRLNDP